MSRDESRFGVEGGRQVEFNLRGILQVSFVNCMIDVDLIMLYYHYYIICYYILLHIIMYYNKLSCTITHYHLV